MPAASMKTSELAAMEIVNRIAISLGWDVRDRLAARFEPTSATVPANP